MTTCTPCVSTAVVAAETKPVMRVICTSPDCATLEKHFVGTCATAAKKPVMRVICTNPDCASFEKHFVGTCKKTDGYARVQAVKRAERAERTAREEKVEANRNAVQAQWRADRDAFKLRDARRRGFCIDYIKDECRFGDRCKFSHDDDAASTRPPSDDGWAAPPNPTPKAAPPTPAPKKNLSPMLSVEEEKEAKKIEKKLREIVAIEERIKNADKVDKLQQEKVLQKQSLLDSLVMAKIRAGHLRRP